MSWDKVGAGETTNWGQHKASLSFGRQAKLISKSASTDDAACAAAPATYAAFSKAPVPAAPAPQVA